MAISSNVFGGKMFWENPGLVNIYMHSLRGEEKAIDSHNLAVTFTPSYL